MYHTCPILNTLQVQTLRLTLALRLKHSLPCTPEIGHLHPHSALTKSHQTSFAANSLDIRTRQVVLLVDEFVEVDVVAEGHFGGMEGKDLFLGVF